MEYGLRDYGIDGQLGREKTPQEYISNLMAIMNECKRVLKKSGSLWVNIGDSYAGHKGEMRNPGYKNKQNGYEYVQDCYNKKEYWVKGAPIKSLIGIPERFVIAMTDSGWIRRNTIIWYKPNCMPSSAKDRFTVDFEYFYFFTKSPKYYFETQYEPFSDSPVGWRKDGRTAINGKGNGELSKRNRFGESSDNGRIKRSVWKITTRSFRDAHFATFPEALVETPIKACCPPNGVVLDPFFGSGTVGVVTKKLGRNFLGIELNESYIQIAQNRLEKHK